MAALAPSAQIVVFDVLGLMIQMRDREDDARAGRGMRLSIHGTAVWKGGRALAAVSRTLANALADLTPIFRVAQAVLSPNRHHSLPFSKCMVASAILLWFALRV